MSDRTPSSRTEKQAHILAAAHQLFLANGYKRTSMEAIRALAGVSKPTLYTHYADKEELFAAVIRTSFDAAGISMLPTHFHITTRAELQQVLIALATQATRTIMTPEYLALLRNIISEMPHFPQLIDIFRNNGPVRSLAMASQLFHHAYHNGVIHVADSQLAARMFMGPMMTYIFTDGLLQAGDPQPPAPTIIEQHVDLFLNAVTPPAQPA